MTQERQQARKDKDINFRELTEHILKLYLNASGEDAGVLELLDEDLSVIGTGKQEFFRNLQEFLPVFLAGEEHRAEVHFEWQNFTQYERRLDEDHVLVYGTALILGAFKSGYIGISMDTRFSILYGWTGGRWKMMHIHHSIPDKEQLENEEFPHTLGKQLEQSQSVFSVFARNFQVVYLVYLKKETARVLKFQTKYVHLPKMNENQECAYQDLLSPWIETLVHPDDRDALCRSLSLSNLKRQLSLQDEYAGNYRSIATGETHYYRYKVCRMPSEPDCVILGFQNIDAIIREHLEAEQKEREKEEAYQKELITARNNADRANAAKTEFLLRMSHDIRTPINGVMGMLDVEDRYADDIEKLAECRAKIRNASGILLDLINEVLDMSKLESGEILLEHVPFELRSISKEVYEVVKKQAEDRHITIFQKNCNKGRTVLIGSPVHFKRLMMNIVGNAIKYNRDGGSIYITCRTFEEDGTEKLQFKCRDTGIGMSPEFLEHVFEPFTQEARSSRTKYTGTGLGMSITKSIVDKMGGTITVESIKGEGSAFDVIVPVELAAEAELIDAVPEKIPPHALRGVRVLLAEDNELNMEIARFMLEEAGAKVMEAWNGQEAVEAFAASAPGDIDAILMDVMMPIRNGYEATRAIRAMKRADAGIVPIIAMTANAFSEDRRAALEAGMNEHITKPLDARKVIWTVAQLTGKGSDDAL